MKHSLFLPRANTSKGLLLLFGISPCTVRVPKIISIKHKHSFASIAFFTATEIQVENILSIKSFLIHRGSSPENICQLLYITYNTEALFDEIETQSLTD